MLTLVIGIVPGPVQGFERTSEVHEIEIGVQGEEDLDGLIRHCRSLACHLAGLNWLKMGVLYRYRLCREGVEIGEWLNGAEST